jgi:hypothetical protein
MRSVSALSFVLFLASCSSSGSSVTAGEIEITASGEALATEGFAFPPTPGQETSFIDGWSVQLDHFYVSFGDITISEGPNSNPADQAVTGPAVARLDTQFVVDLHKQGPLPGKAEGDKAWPVAKIMNQNLAANKVFDSAKTYAFNYATTPLTATASRIGIDAVSESDLSEMITKGYSVLYVGTASFKGTDCTPSNDASVNALPKSVAFRFGFKTKAKHVNCANPDLGAGEQRGLAIKQNGPTVAQITYHADHPFWNAIEEDAPLRFDAMAFYAGVKGKGTAAAPLTLEDLEGAAYAPVGTTEAITLTERTCKPAAPPSTKSALVLDPKGRSIKDLAAFMSTLQAPQAHLNADGLCALQQ